MIDYPKHPSEFEFQSDVYKFLTDKGYNVRGEVIMKIKGKRGCRFDLVIFNENNLSCLTIEIKKGAHKRAKAPTKLAYYEKVTNLPAIWITPYNLKEQLILIDKLYIALNEKRTN